MNEHLKVINAIEDRFYEEGLLSNVSDIADRTDLSESIVKKRLNELEGEGVFRVYEGQGLPTIYVTKQMKNSLTSEVGEPDWLEEYEFEEKRELREEVQEANDKISEYQLLERLLYGTGDPLEDAIESALERLGFNPETTVENEDFTVEFEDHTYIIEVKGKSGRINKGDINQLGGWLEKKIDEGYRAEELTGVLLHNHERDKPPSDRGDPLTPRAEEFLKIQSSKQMSTEKLFDIMKDFIEDSISEAEARERFVGCIS